ncbi:MAG TPA: YjbE family putative metal transport protein, partial [Methylomirabilota bacterium]
VRTLSRRQQFQGRIWGTVGAVALRLAFIFIVTYLLAIPLLQVVGGLLLVWIALKLVMQSEGHEGAQVKQGTTLLGAVWVILVADVIMSLDNVIGVAAAAEGDMSLVVFGIALSIPIVVWGSGVLARLMNRYPWIILVAGGILGEVAGKMMLHDQFITSRFGEANAGVEAALRIGLALAIVLVGWLVTRRRAAALDHGATAR